MGQCDVAAIDRRRLQHSPIEPIYNQYSKPRGSKGSSETKTGRSGTDNDNILIHNRIIDTVLSQTIRTNTDS